MTLGESAYNAWRKARGVEFFDDPPWDDMCSDEQAYWEVAGAAVLDYAETLPDGPPVGYFRCSKCGQAMG